MRLCVIVSGRWFSYRWTQIFDACGIPATVSVLRASRGKPGSAEPFSPPPIEEVVAFIKENKPDVVFAAHVETSAGLMLPMDYIRSIGEAIHSIGGAFVLDCIASGCIWVDMKACEVDVLISAPQKGWSSTPCAALVMLSATAASLLGTTTSSSFVCDLKKWHQIMVAYENGGFAYHATMPTDSIVSFWTAMKETEAFGFERAREAQFILGSRVRELLESRGYTSVAAEGFKSPAVITSYTTDPDIKTGKKFVEIGAQIAAGVPLQCDEGSDFSTFRIGLFGLYKIQNVDETFDRFKDILDKLE